MNICIFLYNLFCGTTNTGNTISLLRNKLKSNNDPIIQRYLEVLQYSYKLLKLKQKLFRGLRFLQFLGGFGITTMTTYNNPYFKDNTDKISIIVWYTSISNTILNIFIEKLNAYDLTTEKMKVNLLIREGQLFIDNEKDYRYYAENDRKDKYDYFQSCYVSIITCDPYNYLTNPTEHKNLDLNNSRQRRMLKVWTTVPTPPETEPETESIPHGTRNEHDIPGFIENIEK